MSSRYYYKVGTITEAFASPQEQRHLFSSHITSATKPRDNQNISYDPRAVDLRAPANGFEFRNLRVIITLSVHHASAFHFFLVSLACAGGHVDDGDWKTPTLSVKTRWVLRIVKYCRKILLNVT